MPDPREERSPARPGGLRHIGDGLQAPLREIAQRTYASRRSRSLQDQVLGRFEMVSVFQGLLPDELCRRPLWTMSGRASVSRAYQERFVMYEEGQGNQRVEILQTTRAPLGFPTIYDMEVLICLCAMHVEQRLASGHDIPDNAVAFTLYELARRFGHAPKNISSTLLTNLAGSIARLRETVYEISVTDRPIVPAITPAAAGRPPRLEMRLPAPGRVLNISLFQVTVSNVGPRRGQRILFFSDPVIDWINSNRFALIDFRRVRALSRPAAKRLLVFLNSQDHPADRETPGWGGYQITVDRDLIVRLGSAEARKDKQRKLVREAVEEINVLCDRCYKTVRILTPADQQWWCGACNEPARDVVSLVPTADGRNWKVVYRRQLGRLEQVRPPRELPAG